MPVVRGEGARTRRAAAMNFENRSYLSALSYEAVDPHGVPFEVVAARGTFALRAAAGAEALGGLTHVAVPLDEQPELAFSDRYHGEINRSSVRAESDLAQYKPRCDVIVVGSAHSPSGRAVPRVEVAVRIVRDERPPSGDDVGTLLSRRLVVHGERAFTRRGDGWALEAAEPFTELPIRYEHAFGGELRVREGDEAADRIADAHRLSAEARRGHPDALGGGSPPVAHTCCPYNPLGVGWLEGWYADAHRVDRWPAPRIEAAGETITPEAFGRLVRGDLRAGKTSALMPQGFGVIAKPWQPRLGLAGTFDEAWRETRWPLMPLDFDMAYWNGAHPAMQCPLLCGGERVELDNLLPPDAPGVARSDRPRVTCRFALPAVRVGVHFTGPPGEGAWLGARIDTVIVDLVEMQLSVVWRAITKAAGIRAAELVAVHDHLSGARPPAGRSPNVESEGE